MLKPCPFCNSQSLVSRRILDEAEWYWRIVCLTCQTEGPRTADNYYGDEAKKLWNTREGT